MRVGIYARVSKQDQQTLPMQMRTIRKYVKQRNWKIVFEVQDVGSGVSDRKKRQELLLAARKRELDAIVVWKLDRWGRSLSDLIGTLDELTELGVAFISITEAVDLSTPMGRAIAGMLSVFANFERSMLSERIKAGIKHSRSKGQRHGRPKTTSKFKSKVKELYKKGESQSAIARKLKISRSSVARLLGKRNYSKSS